MVTKESLIRNFKESIPAWRSESVHYHYPNLITHFIEYVGAKDSYDRADTMKFLNHLANNGQSKNSVRWSAYILSQFYRSLGITFPLTPGDLPPAPEPEELNAPVLSKEYVAKLIAVVKEKGDTRMKAYLALSTTFGLRRAELATLSSQNISDGRLHFKSVKGGRMRDHIIPKEIEPYISNFNFKLVHPQNYIYLFSKIQKLAGVKHEQREGWHSIRRSLITQLLGAGVLPHLVFDFIGWKLSSKMGILGTYSRPDPEERDKIIMKSHPFLFSWR